MLRILFLILVLMSSIAFAQNEARKINEVEIAKHSESLDVALEGLVIELNENPKAQGYIVNYGVVKKIARREFQLKQNLKFRKFDFNRVVFVRGGYRNQTKTEFWLVPEGAEKPKLLPTAKIVDEVGNISESKWKTRMQNLRTKLQELSKDDFQLYIITYGTEKETVSAEANIKKYLFDKNCRDCFPDMRIIFVQGGNIGESKSVFWIVPAGVETPIP